VCETAPANKWFEVDVATLDKPADDQLEDPSKLFKNTDQSEFLTALQKETNMPDALRVQLEQAMGNPEQLQAFISERISIDQGIDFTLDDVQNGKIATLMEQSLGSVLGKEFTQVVNQYRLNFLGNDLIKQAVETKTKQIDTLVKEVKFQEMITAINAQSREDFEQSGSSGEYPGDHKEFKLKVYQGGNVLRITPKEPKEFEKYRFAGNTNDVIRKRVQEELENPFKNIPILGSIFGMLSKIPGVGTQIRSLFMPLAAKFGIKVPEQDPNKSMDEIIEERTREKLNQVLPISEATMYHRVGFDELVKLADVNDGITSEEAGGKESVMLDRKFDHFSGTISIPAGKSIRFSKPVNISGAEGYKFETFKNASRVEAIYVPQGQTLQITLSDQVIDQYSIFPVGTKITRTGEGTT
jgi:hypothetical protein